MGATMGRYLTRYCTMVGHNHRLYHHCWIMKFYIFLFSVILSFRSLSGGDTLWVILLVFIVWLDNIRVGWLGSHPAMYCIMILVTILLWKMWNGSSLREKRERNKGLHIIINSRKDRNPRSFRYYPYIGVTHIHTLDGTI